MNRGELNWVYTHIVNICTITPSDAWASPWFNELWGSSRKHQHNTESFEQNQKARDIINTSN